MAVDYLSAMNVGSGLNVTQIVDALVEAEKAPREAQITEKIEEKTVSVSGFAQVKTEFSTLKTNLATLSQVSGLKLQTTGPAGASTVVSATASDTSQIQAFDYNMTVSSLASAQTVSFGGYNSATATIDASNLIINLGTWAVDNSGNHSFSAKTTIANQNISLDGTDTLSTVRDKINGLKIGIEATIIKISENNFTLALRSPTGTDNQIRVQATSTTGSISNLSFDPATNGSGAANGGDAQKQVAAATNATFNLNGINITRSTNKITDIIPGVTLDLKSVSGTAQKIIASYDETVSIDAMKLFVAELNAVTANLTSLTKTSLTEDENGPLSGDTLVRAYRNRIRLITTTPIEGYGVDKVYLSNFGVMTNRDGTLSLNEAKFKAYFASKPQEFTAFTTNITKADNPAVTATMTGSLWKPGAYQFESVVRGATSVLSAAEASSQTFKTIDSSLNSGDGQLSDSLQAYVAKNAGGTWSVSGTDGNALSVDSSGVVTVTGGTNYEAKANYSFNVEYSISASEKFVEAVTLNVSDLAEREYTVATPYVPSTVAVGDKFTVTADGQSIVATMANSDAGAFTIANLASKLNTANAALGTPADGTFSVNNTNDIVFKFNDKATAQTGTVSSIQFEANAPVVASSVQTNGAVTARVVTLADHGTPAFETAMNGSAADGDKYVINIGGQDVAYTLSATGNGGASDTTHLQSLGSLNERVAYLAGKLDTAANTAGVASADIGFGITASGSSFLVTANTAGTAANAAVVGPVRLDPNGASTEADLGAAASDAAGTDTPEVLQWQAPTMPTTASGDKFSVTIDNNGSAVTVTTGVLGASATLTAVKDALNTAHNSVNGTFSVSGNDLRFTYNANQGNVTNTNDGALKYIPQAGTVSNSTAGVGQPALTAVTEVSHVAANPTATLSTRVVDENGVVTYTNTATMSLENGTFKTTSGDAKGIQIKVAGTQSSIIYVGKSLFNALTEFSDSVLKTNGDIDKKVARYNTDVVDYNKELTELETRMENVRERYIEQFTAMESAVSSFKSTGDMLDNLMESWKASLS